jgi:predicted chitinase
VIAAAESGPAVDFVLGPPGSAERTAHESQIADYVLKMAEAFEIMQIDTIQAQADFVAHSVGETLLAKLTEAQTNKFIDDPTKVTVSTSLDRDARGTTRGPRRYMGKPLIGKPLIDPLNVITQTGFMDPALFRQTFIGRGPIQVTDRTNYLHSLMYLELRADELQKELDALPPDPSPQRTKLAAQIALLREAVDKIAPPMSSGGSMMRCCVAGHPRSVEASGTRPRQALPLSLACATRSRLGPALV